MPRNRNTRRLTTAQAVAAVSRLLPSAARLVNRERVTHEDAEDMLLRAAALHGYLDDVTELAICDALNHELELQRWLAQSVEDLGHCSQ
jgi:hypothetical protein